VIDSEKGLVLFSSNLNFQKAPIAEAFATTLNLRFFGQRCNAAALGEARLGLHKDVVTLL
jgi:predicted NBD/HSP70 family sugar kinase